MQLAIAWIVYFGVWGMSYPMAKRKRNRVADVLLLLVCATDVVYLGMTDLRTLLFVLLATFIACVNTSLMIVNGMQQSTLEEMYAMDKLRKSEETFKQEV